MALVWIIERDPSAVRAVWNRARRNATEWVASPLAESDGTGAEHKKSWELKALDPPTVGDVDAVIDEEAAFMLPPFIVTGLAARGALWASLQSGRLPAQGKRCGTSERIEIPMSHWTDLDWLPDRAASADTVVGRMENAPKYDEVSVSGQKVREIWPPLEDVPSEEYHREDWTPDHAALWIAYRNPALFHFVGLSGPRAQAQFSSAERQDSAPKKMTLMNALKTGQLKAIRNGQEIPPEYWFGRKPPGWQPEATRYYFRRSDVMRIFKDKPPPVVNSKDESIAKKLLAGAPGNNFDLPAARIDDAVAEGGRRRKFKRAKRAIDDLWPTGVPDQVTLGNKMLCKTVAAKVNKPKPHDMDNILDDTILRAAGRRK
jgi:hypothetical protein